MDIQLNSILSTIPPKKVLYEKQKILESCENCRGKTLAEACHRCGIFNKVLDRYAVANIPVKYWHLNVGDQFLGDPSLKAKYLEIVGENKELLDETYRKGTCLCFSGSYGTGKTTILCNILKRALEKGYSGYYGSLNHLVNSVVYDSDSKTELRKVFLQSDFLCIDEFDSRHMGSDNAAELFGRILEDIFRTRAQNCLPTFMCTNSTNVVGSFQGAIKDSISSLMNYVENVYVIGKDLRKEGL